MDVDPHLPRHFFGWYSPRLGLDMPVVSYGYAGHPLLLFPTANSDFLDNERFGLIQAIAHHIFAGRVRVFGIDTVNRLSWMSDQVSIPEKARRQALYSAYVEEEVAPFIRNTIGNPSARIATAGASFGAFHAFNALFRRPDLFDTTIAMSGFYDLAPDYLHGYSDDNCYFNNPAWYVPNIGDPHALHLLRVATGVHLVSGRGAYEAPHESEKMSQILRDKHIPHGLDLWGHDVNHDWPWWKKMLNHYISERLGW